MINNKDAAIKIKQILGLESEPVAVFFLGNDGIKEFDSFTKLVKHRYCQLLMRARRGESVLLTPEELACPAAAAAFGLRPLTETLASGKGLVGFGIVNDAETGKAIFESMPKLKSRTVSAIAALPLEKAEKTPDIIIIEGKPEQLMWLLLSDLNVAGGKRRKGDTAVLQATCVDATVIPMLEQRMNFSMGCYGCREATDMEPAETVLGFPANHLHGLMSALDNLAQNAIIRSRAKDVYKSLKNQMDSGKNVMENQ